MRSLSWTRVSILLLTALTVAGFLGVLLSERGRESTGPADHAKLPVDTSQRPGFSARRAEAPRELRLVEWVELLARLRAEGQNSEILRVLGRLEEKHPDWLAPNDLHVVGGDAARATGDAARAVRFYRLALSSNTPLGTATRFREANALIELGDAAAAETTLRPLLDASTPRETRRDATLLVAQAWRKTGPPEQAAARYRSILSNKSLKAEHGAARLELAKTELEMGRISAAAAELRRLLDDRRLTLRKVDALLLLKEIEAKSPREAAIPSAADHLKRGQLCYESGHFDEGVDELTAAIRKAGRGTIAADARYLLGRLEYRRERFEEALDRYVTAMRHEKAPRYRQKCLMQSARCLQILGRSDEATAALKQVVALGTRSDDGAWARYELAAQAEREGRLDEAVAAYTALSREKSSRIVGNVSLLQVVRIQVTQGKASAAIASAQKLLNVEPRGRNSPQALLYLAREFEKSGNQQAAISTYQRCMDELPGTLEATLAEKRLSELRPPAASSAAADGLVSGIARPTGGVPESFLEFVVALRRIPALFGFNEVTGLAPAPVFATELERANFLASYGPDAAAQAIARARIEMRNGMNEDAAQELTVALRRFPDNFDLLLTGLALSHATGQPPKALRYAERLADLLPGGGHTENLPGPLVRELYPWPHRQTMEAIGRRVGIDPLLAIAVIRQESRYDTQARSLAAARGLMQLVPVTFEGLRQALGRAELAFEDAHRPEIGLEMGMTYLRQLGERFGGRPEVVLAAYNAGPGNAERWLAQTHTDEPLDFVSTITFKETRDYVRLVQYNWWVYHDLYRNGASPPPLMLTEPEAPARRPTAPVPTSAPDDSQPEPPFQAAGAGTRGQAGAAPESN